MHPLIRMTKQQRTAKEEVAPKKDFHAEDINQRYLNKYRAKPDQRFVSAFDTTVRLHQKLFGSLTNKSQYHIGKIFQDDGFQTLSLLKDATVVESFRLSIPLDFSKVMAALGQCLTRVAEGRRPVSDPIVRDSYWMGQYASAMQNFYSIDPRSIIGGLLELEDLWAKDGPDARLALAAARGYALLHMGLYPDYMQYKDEFSSTALAWLALARSMDPALSTGREETLLAMSMGYTAYAERLLEKSPATVKNASDRIFDAYMRKDLETLKKMKGEGSRVLGYYFLARLYRKNGLHKKAAEISAELFQRFPNHYPTFVELIYSADLGVAKRLSVFYPLDILARTTFGVSMESVGDPELWKKRFEAFSGGESEEGCVSIAKFEELLSAWKPLEENRARGGFIDDRQIKNIFRTLYSGALYLRFNILLKRWGVVERAENFCKAISGEMESHPIVLLMSALVQEELGNQKQADAISRRILNAPQTSAAIAIKAYFCTNDMTHKLEFAPMVAGKTDGRPGHLTNMGYVFQWLHHYDMAETYYRLAIEQDPYDYSNYRYLAWVTRSDEPISKALNRFSNDYVFLEEAGDYYSELDDPVMKEKALKCYDQALAFVPSRDDLWQKKADMLRDLNRHEEAVQTLEEWLRKYGGNDLATTLIRASLAARYLDLNQPGKALDTLESEADSYQAGAMMNLAKIYEALGRIEDAEAMLKKALDRYPTINHVLSKSAAFMWRNGRNLEAARLIAKGRKLNGASSRWYFDDFMSVFASAPKDRILSEIKLLAENGMTTWEISAMGFRFEKNGRPDVAFALVSRAVPKNYMLQLENIADQYKLLKDWKGKSAADRIVASQLSPRVNIYFSIVLFKEGMFDLLFSGIRNPDDYEPQHREFMWLMKLAAWKAFDGPAEAAVEFDRHYRSKGADYYHTIGKYLMGMIPRPALLEAIKSPKQICEISYYIGFAERLKGNFPEAANWYHICLETGLSNNGEYHWASDELFWWAHMGTRKRHRIVADDIRAYHQKSI